MGGVCVSALPPAKRAATQQSGSELFGCEISHRCLGVSGDDVVLVEKRVGNGTACGSTKQQSCMRSAPMERSPLESTSKFGATEVWNETSSSGKRSQIYTRARNWAKASPSGHDRTMLGRQLPNKFWCEAGYHDDDRVLDGAMADDLGVDEELMVETTEASPWRGELVFLHLYDLSEGFAHVNSVALDIFGVGGVLHAGVEVFREEYSFGTGGVSVCLPRCHQQYAYRETVEMGRTHLRRSEVETLLAELRSEWQGKQYDLFVRNCGSFCNELCERLGVGCVPPWVTRFGDALGQVPAARRIANALQNSSAFGGEDFSQNPSPSKRDYDPLIGTSFRNEEIYTECETHVYDPSDHNINAMPLGQLLGGRCIRDQEEVADKWAVEAAFSLGLAAGRSAYDNTALGYGGWPLPYNKSSRSEQFRIDFRDMPDARAQEEYMMRCQQDHSSRAWHGTASPFDAPQFDGSGSPTPHAQLFGDAAGLWPPPGRFGGFPVVHSRHWPVSSAVRGGGA